MTERVGNVQVRDEKSLQQGLERYSRDIKQVTEGDIVVEMPRRMFLRDTNGIYWQITVSTTGVLTTTSVGATLP